MRWHTFEVRGNPVAQGSKRALKHRTTGNVIMMESSKHLPTWRQDVAGEAAKALDGQGPIEGPVILHCTFFVKTPLKPKRALPITQPDLDKMVRAICDALQAAGMFRNDSQVVSLTAKKRYAYDSAPRVHIAVGEEEG